MLSIKISAAIIGIFIIGAIFGYFICAVLVMGKAADRYAEEILTREEKC